jgi:hypothetical protein
MRILDDVTDRRLNRVSLFLTKGEAKILIGYLKQLIIGKENHDHSHISSEDDQKEIMICVYDPASVSNFASRVQKLIAEDR